MLTQGAPGADDIGDGIGYPELCLQVLADAGLDYPAGGGQ